MVAGVGEMVYGLVPPAGVNTTLPVETQPDGCVITRLSVKAAGTALIVAETVAVQFDASVTVYLYSYRCVELYRHSICHN